MKRNPSFLIAIAVVGAFIALHVCYNHLATAPIFRNTETEFRRNSDRPLQSLPLAAQHNFTCEQNHDAIIDSFGTPCLNISKFLERQNILIHSSNNLSYVYCSIPKNGCTYHTAVMHRLMGYPYEGGGNVHAPENTNRLREAYTNITQLLLSENVPKYAIIRNPLQRVLSAYLNKVEVLYEDESQKTPESFHKWIYVDEGLKPNMDWKKRNPHWIAQVRFCGFQERDFAKYLRVFRVEEPAEYVEYMESFLPEHVLKDGWDMPLNKSFRQHVLGPRRRTENTTARFFQYMGNLRTFDYLAEVYREDIDILGYREEVEKLREELIARLEQ